jgi:iron-sulfur cluster assembly protein
MSVTVTEKAAKEIQRVLSEQKMSESTVLRIGVAGGGCSGFQYSLGFDDKTDAAKDHVTTQHGVPVAVDKKSDLFLDGTVIDFYDGIEKRGFTFENPNAVKSCGCGQSFSAWSSRCRWDFGERLGEAVRCSDAATDDRFKIA